MEPALAAAQMRHLWLAEARPNQLPPQGEWNVWVVLAGRGFGKTRTGAEDLAWYALLHPGSYCTVIAPTYNDVRFTCIEGESGLLATLPPHVITKYNKSLFTIELYNGSIIRGFSAEEPQRLRGPQHHRIWGDELGAWDKLVETYDMAMLGLRLGEDPRAVFTTTPKPLAFIRRMINGDVPLKVAVTRGTTHDNKANLAPTFFKQITQYEGTQLGRQEIYGEVLDSEEGGIFKRSAFRLWPADKPLPRFVHVLQSYDTAFTLREAKRMANIHRSAGGERGGPDFTACTTWGIFSPHEAFDFRREPNTPKFGAILCDAWHERLEYPDLRLRARREYATRYGAGDSVGESKGRFPDTVLIEEKGSGISLIQDLRRSRVPVRPFNPGRADKLQRAHSVSHLQHAGLFWVPESQTAAGNPRNWCNPFLSEVCSFSAETFNKQRDDYVDSFTQAAACLATMTWLSIDNYDNLEDQDELVYADGRYGQVQNPYVM